MPGYAWSIPAQECITGSKLAQIEGTPCSLCYAKKGRYRFRNVEDAQYIRLWAWKLQPKWVEWMSARLLWLAPKHPYFRWFDAGDIQSVKMLKDIIMVCQNTQGYVQHWLPTQERTFVKVMQDQIPDNLNIRISSTKINEVQHSTLMNVTNSAVSNYEWNCPSHLQNNMCLDCRKCWDKEEKHVIYRLH